MSKESNVYSYTIECQERENIIRKRLVNEDVPADEADMFSVYKGNNFKRFTVPEYSEAELKIPTILKKHQDSQIRYRRLQQIHTWKRYA